MQVLYVKSISVNVQFVPCQGRSRGFESRFPLQKQKIKDSAKRGWVLFLCNWRVNLQSSPNCSSPLAADLTHLNPELFLKISPLQIYAGHRQLRHSPCGFPTVGRACLQCLDRMVRVPVTPGPPENAETSERLGAPAA